MISIPLYVTLFIYLAFLCVFFIFVFVHMYHIFMSASFTLASFIMTFLVMVFGIFTLYFTFTLLAEVDWTQKMIIFNGEWISSIFKGPETF